MPSVTSAAEAGIEAPASVLGGSAPWAVPPMLTRPIEAPAIEPLSRWTSAATPTVAQSWARRFAFRYAQPVEAASFGTRLDEHLVGPERGLEHAREELRGRDHPLSTEPWATSSAPRASITAGMSDAGSPCASVPPSVPR